MQQNLSVNTIYEPTENIVGGNRVLKWGFMKNIKEGKNWWKREENKKHGRSSCPWLNFESRRSSGKPVGTHRLNKSVSDDES